MMGSLRPMEPAPLTTASGSTPSFLRAPSSLSYSSRSFLENKNNSGKRRKEGRNDGRSFTTVGQAVQGEGRRTRQQRHISAGREAVNEARRRRTRRKEGLKEREKEKWRRRRYNKFDGNL